jgi:hypothetical protein
MEPWAECDAEMAQHAHRASACGGEHPFARLVQMYGKWVRTIGLARAKVQIGLKVVMHNLQRLARMKEAGVRDRRGAVAASEEPKVWCVSYRHADCRSSSQTNYAEMRVIPRRPRILISSKTRKTSARA